MSAGPTEGCPPWGSIPPTCPTKCATSGRRKYTDSRLPPPTVRLWSLEGWVDSPPTYGTGTPPQCAMTTSPRPSWPPSRSERNWRRGKNARWCTDAPKPASTPRTLPRSMGVTVYRPKLATRRGLVALAPEAQRPQPMGAPGTTSWGLGWWATVKEPLCSATLAPHWAAPLGLHPPPCTQITVAPTAARTGPLAPKGPIALRFTNLTPLPCPDPPPTPTRNSPTSMLMRRQSHLDWGAKGMSPKSAPPPVRLHALSWPGGWGMVFPLETLPDILSGSYRYLFASVTDPHVSSFWFVCLPV